jgi:hypothetical protein
MLFSQEKVKTFARNPKHLNFCSDMKKWEIYLRASFSAAQSHIWSYLEAISKYLFK